MLITTVVEAGKKELLFKLLSKEQGLPGDNVQSVFQDSYGYIWFGIESVGLCKYDGNRYTVYGIDNSDNNSLSTSFINFMVEDKNNNLWLATEHGLNIFDRHSGVFNSYFTPNLPNNRIKTIYKDDSDAIWIGTEKGIRKFIPIEKCAPNQFFFGFENCKTKYVIDNNPAFALVENEIVNSIIMDKAKNVWLGTFSGLYRFNGNDTLKECKRIIIDTTDITANRINDIAILPNGNLLLGTNVGLTLFNVKTYATTSLNNIPDNNFSTTSFGVTKLLVDRNGITWIGTNLDGILSGQIDAHQSFGVKIPTAINGLEGTHIRNIFEDRTGQIWVITKYAGIYTFDPRSQLFPNYFTNNKTLNFVLSACETTNGTILLGTKFGSLLQFDRKNASITQKKIHFGDDYLNRIEFIFEDSAKNIWLGYKKGLVMLDANLQPKRKYEAPKVYGINVDQSGIFWIFTIDGVYFLNKNTNKIEKYNLAKYGKELEDQNIIVQAIYSDRNKNIWFTTYANGVFKYNPLTKNLTCYKNEGGKANSLSGNAIRSFYEDSKGTIWVGTKFSGLNEYCPETNTFRQYSINYGLPSNAIYSIVEDDNENLWICTNNGVSKFDVEKKQFYNFNEKHGLQGNVFEPRSTIRLKNNDILFGGNNGFNLFTPEKVNIDSFIPPLTVTHILANNNTIAKDLFSNNEIFIPFKNSKLITIFFSALDYRDPSSIKYAYRLDGVDTEWNYANQHNSITYSNLKHGNYRFRFKATNADEIWTGNEMFVPIMIETPMWLRWWAYLFYIAFGLAILFAIYHFATIRANYKHQLLLKEQELFRNKELNQMKLRFFTNISHEIRTPLTLILAPLHNLLNNYDFNDNIISKLSLIDKSANRLLKLTDQLLYFRKAQQDKQKLEVNHSDLVQFVSEIIAPFYELAENNNLKFSFQTPKKELLTWFDPDKIEKIISNLLSNAFKFTPREGSVVIKLYETELTNTTTKSFWTKGIEQKSNYIKIEISDSGFGMNLEQQKHVFERFYQAEPFDTGVGIGLEFVKQLVEIHHGKIDVESAPNQGTTFSVYLPFNKDVYKTDTLLSNQIIANNYVTNKSLSLFYNNNDDHQYQTKQTNNQQQSKPKILVVEDDRDLQAYLHQMFIDSYFVLIAENGEKGFELCKKEMPEIIITDVMMPKVNGFQFCEMVKSDMAVSHIPLIMLSAKNLDNDQLEGLSFGADDYITKPFNDEIVKARIKNIMASRKKLQQKYAKTIYVNPAEITTNKTDELFTSKLLETIDSDISNPDLSISEIANRLNMDRTNLFKKIKSIFGKSPSQFIREYRIKKAAKFLLENKFNINEISYMVGFSSPAYFSKLFKEVFGLPPSEFLNANNKKQ